MPIAPVHALEKVILEDPDNPQRSRIALFNPTELTAVVRTKLGRLDPIGSSSTIKQYASTQDVPINLTFEYSFQAFKDRLLNSEYVNFMEAQRFFQSFCYGRARGFAPGHLRLIWPNTLAMLLAVQSVSVSFRNWDASLKVRDYAVSISAFEHTTSFFSSDNAYKQGFQRDSSETFVADIGRPINLSGKALSKRILEGLE